MSFGIFQIPSEGVYAASLARDLAREMHQNPDLEIDYP